MELIGCGKALRGADMLFDIFHINERSKAMKTIFFAITLIAILTINASANDTEIAYLKGAKPMTGEVKGTTFVKDVGEFKCYEDYRCITDKSSDQYKLQQRAKTGAYGLRRLLMRNGVSNHGELQYVNAYCVAMGSHFGTKIGTLYRVDMKNGEHFHVVLADQKADSDTAENRHISDANGCVLEFLVDTERLTPLVKKMGDISFVRQKKFYGPIKRIVREDQ